jgi:membrane protein YdbS with pleckstrin-like domain
VGPSGGPGTDRSPGHGDASHPTTDHGTPPSAQPWGPGAPPASTLEPTALGSEVERPGLDDRERSLDPRIVHVWRIFGTFGMLFPLAVPTVLLFVFTDVWGWVALVPSVALLLSSATWYPPVRYRRWRWQLTTLALELRYGVIVRQQESVPYFRVQQIDIAQGPVDRLLGIATLQVTTASASGSATLPGITAEDAPAVRAELLARASEAVAAHDGDLRDAV